MTPGTGHGAQQCSEALGNVLGPAEFRLALRARASALDPLVCNLLSQLDVSVCSEVQGPHARRGP